ncbi:hypothetical protein Q672_02240 [Marinobacter sp. EVN1]|nr:hypothetical protein Q672_02240 [Marinobacter sp. EVN1]
MIDGAAGVNDRINSDPCARLYNTSRHQLNAVAYVSVVRDPGKRMDERWEVKTHCSETLEHTLTNETSGHHSNSIEQKNRLWVYPRQIFIPSESLQAIPDLVVCALKLRIANAEDIGTAQFCEFPYNLRMPARPY